jgi:cytochrome oxidase Cu insertion factor (SCO1/SenC/PrrC family)
MIRREDAWPLAALAFILAVSAAWWGFALWAVPGAPDWLERARAVCFNITESGLPGTTGWMLLLGEPPMMAAMLWVGWHNQVVGTIRHLMSSGRGRAAVGGAVALVLAGLALAGARVADARLPEVRWGAEGPASASHPRLERPWPTLARLVDQSGEAFTLARLGGRPALVTFAFGHCATLCPLVVHQVSAAREEIAARFSLVVFTVDPWRDTPSRLGPLLAQWGLDPARDFVVGGSVEAVEAALDAWEIGRTRDERTGDIVHPGVVYLVESGGRIAFSSTGGIEHLVSLGGRLERTRALPIPP